MSRYRIVIAYDGGPYNGWQRQPTVPTVQRALEDATTQMNAGEPLLVKGASRTDSGVHAEGQIATFDYEGHLTLRDWHRGLNALTSPAISIRDVSLVAPDFHPRFHSRGKWYRYVLWRGLGPPPALRPRCWAVSKRLDAQRLREAAQRLVGVHDFAAFRAADCDSRTTEREIRRIEVTELPSYGTPLPSEEGSAIAIDVFGNAFLKYMVRIITGTLVDAGLGRTSPDRISEILASGERWLAGRTAPAQGLTLVRVYLVDDADHVT